MTAARSSAGRITARTTATGTSSACQAGPSPTPASRRGVPSAVNLARRIAEFSDGTTNTILFSEIKSFQFRLKCALFAHDRDRQPQHDPGAQCPAPGRVRRRRFLLAPSVTMHTRWSNGGVYHAGFTTAWPPEQEDLLQLPAGPLHLTPAPSRRPRRRRPDLVNENDGGPTFGAFTSRSYHPGGVNVGSSPTAASSSSRDSVNGTTWRALGTVQGGEITSSDAY